MKRFSVLVREFGSKREVDLLQVDSNPKAIALALEMKKLWGVNKYSSVRIVDHAPDPDQSSKSIISDREIMGVADDELPPWEESP
jgi:hypothetical protein